MSDSTSPAATAAAISMIDVLRGVGRRKWLLLLAGLVSLAVAVLVVQRLAPSYTAQAQVLIENLETPFDRVQSGNQQGGGGGVIDDRVVASQMAVLKSLDLGRRVVAALKLDQNPSFNPLLTKAGLGRKLEIRLGFMDDPALKTPDQLALDSYASDLAVYPEPDSNVINIKVVSSDPKATADIANTLSEMYVMTTRESEIEPTERAREWLQQQITDLRGRLATAERAVEEFRSQAGLLQSTNTTLSTQQISDLNAQITIAQTASAEAKARADSIREILKKNGNVDGASEVINSPVIQRLKEQRTAAVQQVSQLNAVYLPNHPKLIAANKALADIDSQIKAEALKIVAGLDEQSRVASAREQALRSSLEQMKTQESASNLDDVKLKALEREAAADRSLLETMLARYAEASARQSVASHPGLARVIQTALVPAVPTFPKKGPMIFLITLAGLLLAFSLLFLNEVMRAASALAMRETAPARPSAPAPAPQPVYVAPPPAEWPAPVLAPVPPVFVPPSPPKLNLQSPPAAPHALPPLATFPATGELGNPDHTAAAGVVAGWVTGCQRDRGARRFGLAGLKTEAASSLAIAVARNLAASGKRVMVVNAAGPSGGVESLAGIASGPGLAELLSGNADFTKVIGRDAASPVHVLRYGNDASPQAFAAIVDRLEQVLTALVPLYDVVLVDCGDSARHALELVPKCDAALLVAPVMRMEEAADQAATLSAPDHAAVRYALVA